MLEIIKAYPEDTIYVTTTGYTSREFHHINNEQFKGRLHHFPMMGSMGNAANIGLGISLNTNRQVTVIDGDGAALMGYANAPILNQKSPINLTYIILCNKCYESTGGQELPPADFRHAMIVVLTTCTEDAPPRIHETLTHFREKIEQTLRDGPKSPD